jgi:N-acetyl-1-D-myo-inositol-2-amino-2-deoxy-alpha-D-glucopyranoside deacetylase
VSTVQPTGPAAIARQGGTARPRGLLAIFAHPDDESFSSGGVLALAAVEGHPVHLVCATDGDMGGGEGAREMDPEIRRGELRRAAEALGISPPVFLGYRDSGMEGWEKPAGCLALADPSEVTARLMAIIQELRPAVVLTFDPGGVYGHPDHTAISAHATAAFRATAGEPGGPRVLYHQALSRSDVARMGELDAAWQTLAGEEPREPTEDDLLQQRRLLELARPDEEITTIVDVSAVVARKLAALACHASQMGGQRWDRAPREMLDAWLGRETFVRVEPPAPGERETALRGLDGTW